MLSKCGHRICSECHTEIINNLLNESTEVTEQYIRCPEKDEECQDSFLNKVEDILPDFACDRELKRLLVVCLNEKYGCNEQMLWKNLQDHLGQCYYNPVECPYKAMGCDVIHSQQEMKTHLKKCMFEPIRCVHCEKDVSKKDMESGHEKICESTPVNCPYERCTFKGLKREVHKHAYEDIKQHLYLILENVKSQKHNQQVAKTEVEDLLKEVLSNKKVIGEQRKSVVAFVDKNNKKLGFIEQNNSKHLSEIQDMKRTATELNNIKPINDMLKKLTERISQLELSQGSAPRGIPEEVVARLQSSQQAITSHEIKLAETDLRFQCLECASYDGMLIWKISDYTRRKQEAVSGITISLYSQPFYTANFGYKLCARVFLNGDGNGKGSHLSLFVVIMKSDFDAIQPWPFQHRVVFQIFDQENSDHITEQFRPDISSTSFKRPVTEMNIASGCPRFVLQSKIETSNKYIKDDTIFFKVKVLMGS